MLAAADPKIALIQQFAEQVVQHQRDTEAAAEVEPQASQPAFTVQPGIQLPQCPHLHVLSTTGVPQNWHEMSLEQQVAHPINAIALQLVGDGGRGCGGGHTAAGGHLDSAAQQPRRLLAGGTQNSSPKQDTTVLFSPVPLTHAGICLLAGRRQSNTG